MAKRKKTVSALMEFDYLPPGSRRSVSRIDDIEIPLASAATCTHEHTLCPECAEQWQAEHLLTERLPWQRRTDDTAA
ncbi:MULTISPECIES: hypothetical protein [unclassified Nocardia]|uniref:hypothetical protein n=1 Tax=unclassified Nocardia TaxID=2637762 RepID=UPI00278BE917|nr:MULTISPECIES: hypothetical protein [unclassified Nocardia]